jgi:hypothetical protein
MPTKFEQRNSAAGKMTGSQVAMGVATGRMSAKDVANAMGKPAKSAATSTKSSATKTTGSYKKPTTPPTKTQNIPEVTVSVTKKKVSSTPVPTTPAVKKEGRLDVDKYVERLPGGEYKEISFQQYHGAKGSGRNVQTVSPSKWEKEKGRVTPMKNK